MNKEKKYVPELKIPFEDYREYLVPNDANRNEDLEIRADKLLMFIEDTSDDVMEYFVREILDSEKEGLTEKNKREIVEEFGFEIQPEVWKMNASTFKRYLCEILELSYHSSNIKILQVISEKMEGLR